MKEQRSWLGKSLERTRESIKARPEHLKPERYRVKKDVVVIAKKDAGKRRAA